MYKEISLEDLVTEIDQIPEDEYTPLKSLSEGYIAEYLTHPILDDLMPKYVDDELLKMVIHRKTENSERGVGTLSGAYVITYNQDYAKSNGLTLDVIATLAIKSLCHAMNNKGISAQKAKIQSPRNPSSTFSGQPEI